MIKKPNESLINKKKFVTLQPVMMNSLEFLEIDLKGLKEEETSLEFNLGNDFFEALEGAEVRQGSLHVSVSIRKVTGFFEILFHTVGHVIVPCDRCLDDMEQPVEADNRLIVKYGSTYSEEDDIIVVPEDEGILDISWFIYEKGFQNGGKRLREKGIRVESLAIVDAMNDETGEITFRH